MHLFGERIKYKELKGGHGSFMLPEFWDEVIKQSNKKILDAA